MSDIDKKINDFKEAREIARKLFPGSMEVRKLMDAGQALVRLLKPPKPLPEAEKETGLSDSAKYKPEDVGRTSATEPDGKGKSK